MQRKGLGLVTNDGIRPNLCNAGGDILFKGIYSTWPGIFWRIAGKAGRKLTMREKKINLKTANIPLPITNYS